MVYITKVEKIMAFFNSAVTTLQTLVCAIGAGLGIFRDNSQLLF